MDTHALDRLGDEIAALSANLDAATAHLLDLIREFDVRAGWNTGFCFCANAGGHARDRGAAAESRTRRHRGPRRAHRARLAPDGPQGRRRRGPAPARASRAARVSRRRRYGGVPRKAGARGRRDAHQGPRRGPRSVVSAGSRDARRDRPGDRFGGNAAEGTAAGRRARAPRRDGADHGINPGAPGERYQVVVHVDAPVLADPDQPGQSVLEDGVRVSAETSQRLACDASRVVMQHSLDGRVVEVSARTRTIPPALRRALHHRDRGCRFPGCGVRFGQGHHIRHWAQGGPTTLSNLVLLCRRHHRAVHEDGYQLARKPDGELQFLRPDGQLLPEVPLVPPVPVDPVGVLRAQHDAEGVVVHAHTATPGWLGERLNVGYAIDVLHPRCAE